MTLRTCTTCKQALSSASFSPRGNGKRRGSCKACRSARERARYDVGADKAAEDDRKVLADAAARARRLASDTEALRPEDFDVGVGNDGKRDPRASAEKRQEFSRAMAGVASELRTGAVAQSEGGDVRDAMSPDSGSYIGKLAEQEARFGNRRLARSISLAAAQEALALRSFKDAARQFLSDKVVATGYARKASKPCKRSAVLLLSDLHLGAELSSLDEPMPFRAVEESRRLEYVVRQLLDYKPQYRKDTEAVVLINGDIIEGALGHDLRSGLPLTEQKVIFWRYFRSIIGVVAQQFPTVRVICQPGNHGRDVVRHPGRATSSKWDGHEWQMYYALQEMCSGLRNVTWTLDFRAVSIVDLHGAKLGLTHGDTEVKLAHPDAGAAKNAAVLDRINSANVYGVQFAAWAFGHFHTPRFHPRNPRAIYNGALVPPNGHARTSGYLGEPCGQWLWEAVEGFPVGDLRFLEVGRSQDEDSKLGAIIAPFRFPNQ